MTGGKMPGSEVKKAIVWVLKKQELSRYAMMRGKLYGIQKMK